MIVAAGPEIIVTSIAKGFANVAFTGSLLVAIAMTAGILWYAKRRPAGEPLTWGQAMAAAMYITFLLFWAFGVVPHQWLTYAEGEMAMRSDAILAGRGSTGWLQHLPGTTKPFPVVITKATVSDLVTVNIYGVAFVASVAVWARWQKRGEKKTEVVETSTYGRPLVKA